MAAFFTVDLHLLTQGEGGRTVPIRSGYQALALFGQTADPGWGVGVTVSFDAPPELAPGDSGLVRMTSWTNTPAPEPGTVLRLHELGRLIANGTVTA